MKKIIFSIVVIAFIIVSCDQKSNNRSNHMNDENMMINDDSTMLYNHSHTLKDGNMMMDNHSSKMPSHSHNMNDGKMVMDNDSTMMYDHSHNGKDGQMMMNNSKMMHNKLNTMENHEKMYACPMHPEVIGNMDEKCSKCGMNLTEPVAIKKEESK